MKVTDIAIAIDKDAEHKIIGIRPGEKLHEEMIGKDDSLYTYEYDGHYKILPAINDLYCSEEIIKKGKQVEDGFSYTSNNNKEHMSIKTLQDWIRSNQDQIGKI